MEIFSCDVSNIFNKYFDPRMPIEDIDEQTYKDYVLHLKKTLKNDKRVFACDVSNIFAYIKY